MVDRNKHYPVDRRLRENIKDLADQARKLPSHEFMNMVALADTLEKLLMDNGPIFLIKPKAK